MTATFTLPDDAKVVVIDGLNRRTYPTLGEVVAATQVMRNPLHPERRADGVDWALSTKGSWAYLGFRVLLLSFKHNGWTIDYDPPTIPIRSMDWAFAHEDFDASWEGEEDGWVGNGLCGRAASPADCLAQIAEIEADRAEAA